MRNRTCLYNERIRICGELNGLSDPESPRRNYGVRTFTEPKIYYILTLSRVLAIAVYMDETIIFWFEVYEIGVQNCHITFDSNNSCHHSYHCNRSN